VKTEMTWDAVAQSILRIAAVRKRPVHQSLLRRILGDHEKPAAARPQDEMFARYYDSFYFPLHGWRDYEALSRVMANGTMTVFRRIEMQDPGHRCADGKFLFF